MNHNEKTIMSANPLYYSNRHSREIMAANPNMTRERYEKGFDRANSLVNTMIGVANEVARLAISDADILNRIGKHALEQNLEVASRYASEEDLEELGVISGRTSDHGASSMSLVSGLK